MTNRQRTERLVSVIIPVYNVEKWLDECVQSIVGQSYDELEIILVDDGSTDSSGARCDAYASRYWNVSVIHKLNGGSSSARNAGIDAASGRWLLFCDSDDMLCDIDCIKKLVDYATKYELDLVRFECRQVDENLKPLSIATKDKSQLTDRVLTNLELIKYAIDGEWFTCLYLIDKDVIGDLRFEEAQTYMEDTDFFARLLINPLRCGYLDEVMYLYRHRAGSLAFTLREDQLVCLACLSDLLYEYSTRIAEPLHSAYYRKLSVMMYYYMLQTLAKSHFYASRKELINRLHINELHDRVYRRLIEADIDTKYKIFINPAPRLGVRLLYVKDRLMERLKELRKR